jgi:hypothetical protein
MPGTARRTGPRPLPCTIRTELLRLRQASRRNSQAIARAERIKALTDTRDWAAERRARTRHLIELGGLVQKAGLVELTDDDRATMLGAFLELAARLQGTDHHGDDPASLLALWRRRGLKAFDADAEQVARKEGHPEGGSAHGRTGALQRS